MTPAKDDPTLVFDYGDGISAIDSGYARPRFDAIHLVVEDGRAALVDTATSHAVARVLSALREKGIAPAAVEWLLLTHVHLDHAGGAGALMREFPNARLAVHPRGARHMADPGMLIKGAAAVYGAGRLRRLYGDILPVDRARIVETPEGAVARLGGREFVFLDTPGHARHHACILDSRTGHVFTGDTFGLSYREFDLGERQFVFPSTTPVQFDPDALHRSVDRIRGHAPGAVYMTHFGRVTGVSRLAQDLHRLIDAHVALARRVRDAGAGRLKSLEEGVRDIALAEASRHGWTLEPREVLEVLRADIALNAQGLDVWLQTDRAPAG